MKQDTVISLFDLTGNMVKPWTDAGYSAVIVDIEHYHAEWPEEDINLTQVGRDLSVFPPAGDFLLSIEPERVAAVFAFPPCTDLAVSGARWFKGKGLRRLAGAIDLFATAAELCEHYDAPYMIENPVSTISTYWRKPDFIFHPHHYTGYEPLDNYTKKTCLWTGGGFIMPPPNVDPTVGEPDNRIHFASPGPERANFRSATPMGFAQAVFEANKP